MGFLDKFFKSKKTDVAPIQEIEEEKLSEKDLEDVNNYPDRKTWLEEHIAKLTNEINSGRLTEAQVYQNEVIMKNYQEELNDILKDEKRRSL